MVKMMGRSGGALCVAVVAAALSGAQAVDPPEEWMCPPEYYNDSALDCFCNADDTSLQQGAVVDLFCRSGDTIPLQGASCDACPVAPEGWTCETSLLNDGICSCGCGAIDPECGAADTTTTRCLNNFEIDGGDHCSSCVDIPFEWSCSIDRYFDGEQCDCACGAPDPDCCNGEVGCTTLTTSCKATWITDGDTCDLCEIPSGWLCGEETYGDQKCNCECGVTDFECEGASTRVCRDGTVVESDSCEVCVFEEIDLPEEWTCSEAKYLDDICQCHCGAPDPACSEDSTTRTICVEGGLSIGNEECSACDNVVPPRWSSTCSDDLVNDGRCTCGCGAIDPECAEDLKVISCRTDFGSFVTKAGSDCSVCEVTEAPSDECADGSCDENTTLIIAIVAGIGGACLLLAVAFYRKFAPSGEPMTEERLIELRNQARERARARARR